MENFLEISNLLNLLTLTGLEIILGVDNVIFIALIVQKLPVNVRNQIRISGLMLALFFRIAMLFAAKWMIGLTTPLFMIQNFPVSGRSLLLLAGGIFLVVKPLLEIKEMFNAEHSEKNIKVKNSFFGSMLQIVFIDIVLSFDSIITAIGVSNNLTTIIIAIIISMIVMIVSAKSVGEFINNNPSVKIIALMFIGMIGVMLIANAFDFDIPKGYLYFAIIFTMLIEIINMKLKKINRQA